MDMCTHARTCILLFCSVRKLLQIQQWRRKFKNCALHDCSTLNMGAEAGVCAFFPQQSRRQFMGLERIQTLHFESKRHAEGSSGINCSLPHMYGQLMWTFVVYWRPRNTPLRCITNTLAVDNPTDQHAWKTCFAKKKTIYSVDNSVLEVRIRCAC